MVDTRHHATYPSTFLIYLEDFHSPNNIYTELGERVVPRLRESRLLTTSGRGWQVHAT